MFEWIFTCLFRLYPSRFREVYADEARWLIRERLCDEKGLLRKSRLCLDLAMDFAVGLPQAYQTVPSEAAAVSVVANAEGVPFFCVLNEQKTGLGPFLVGSGLSLAVLYAFSLILSLPSPDQRLSGSKGRISPIEAVIERLNQPVPAGQATTVRQEVVNPGSKTATMHEAKTSGPPVVTTQPSGPESRRQAAQQNAVASMAVRRTPVSQVVTTHPFEPETRRQATRQAAAASLEARYTGERHVEPGEEANQILGNWQGTLFPSQRNLPMVVKIGETSAGGLHVELYRSDWSGSPLLATSASFHGGYLMFAIQSIGANFDGKMSADGMSIAGTWTQATSSHPLQLTRRPPA